MAAVINTNMASLQAQNQLSRTTANLNNTIQQLSSGLRVNSAADDASGYAISKNMDSVIRGSTVAIRNANDGISFSQTATGALESLSNLLGRMRELATQSANGSNGITNSDLLQTEFASLQDEVIRTISSTKFNGVNTFGTAATTSLDFQIGSGTDVLLDQVTLTTTNLSAVTALNTSSDFIINDGNSGTSIGAQLLNIANSAANLAGANGVSIQKALTTAVGNLKTGAASAAGVLSVADRNLLEAEILSITPGTDTAAAYMVKLSDVYGLVVGGAFVASDATAGTPTTIAAGTGKSGFITQISTVATEKTAAENALDAIEQIDLAITAVNTEAATHGAFQNKLGFVTDNLSSLIQTTSAARSRIMDTDFAAQTAQLSKYQILQQAGTAMLAQANQMGSNVLTLLK